MESRFMRLFYVFCFLINGLNAGKFLFYIYPSVSHFYEKISVASELLNRGHQVDMLYDECLKDDIKESRFTNVYFYKCNGATKVIKDSKKIRDIFEQLFKSEPPAELLKNFGVAHNFGYTIEYKNVLFQLGKEFFKKLFHLSPNSELYKVVGMFPGIKDATHILCNSTIGNKPFLDRLKKERYDYVFIDVLPLQLCFYMLPDYLRVPHITIGSHLMYGAARLNKPFIKLANSRINLFSRLTELITTLVYEYVHNLAADYERYRRIVGYNYENPEITAEKSELWLLNHDFLLQPPQSIPPHVRMVGGLSLKPPAPLTNDYELFADESPNGFIVMSFGSNFAFLPDFLAAKFSKAFSKIPFNVVIRLEDVDGLFINSTNVLIRSWLPQNDLLAHPNCKLFISHCGNNGNFESLYHAVPVIGFPVFADQTQNAQRLHDRGYGIKMNLGDFTADELVSNIMIIASRNSTYREKISVASKIYRRQKPAAMRAADAVEEALRGETRFYFPENSYQLSAFQNNNFDLVVLLFILSLLVLSLTTVCCFFCFRRCVQRLKSKEKYD